MKRILITIATVLALLPTLLATTACSSMVAVAPVPSRDNGLEVDLWTDRLQDAVYYPGDALTLHFRASDDCFVTIYAIGTDGDVRIIFPEYPDDGFVYGGVTYRLPEYYDSGRLRVTGPRGVEYLHAVATRNPDGFMYGSRNGRWHAGVPAITGDPFLAINSINAHLINDRDIAAVNTVSYFVGGRVWYPRYACYDCHGRSARFDPYESSCSRYNVVVAHDYDYWWSYSYHPVRTRYIYAGPFWTVVIRSGHYPHRHAHYTDCAFGYYNYHPIRPIIRPHTHVVYRPDRITTWRSWERSYTRVRVSDTHEKRTRDPRIEYRDRERIVASRERMDATRSRNDASGGGSSTRDRSGTVTGGSGDTRTRDTGGGIDRTNRGNSDSGIRENRTGSNSSTDRPKSGVMEEGRRDRSTNADRPSTTAPGGIRESAPVNPSNNSGSRGTVEEGRRDRSTNADRPSTTAPGGIRESAPVNPSNNSGSRGTVEEGRRDRSTNADRPSTTAPGGIRESAPVNPSNNSGSRGTVEEGRRDRSSNADRPSTTAPGGSMREDRAPERSSIERPREQARPAETPAPRPRMDVGNTERPREERPRESVSRPPATESPRVTPEPSRERPAPAPSRSAAPSSRGADEGSGGRTRSR